MKPTVPKITKVPVPRVAPVSIRATMENAWKKLENSNKKKK
jgi:hypothetical protein